MKENAKAWIKSTNIYEVNLRQYTEEGTLNAFAKEMPRLREMGVNTLWFMPLTPISQKNKKGKLGSYYAASDYTAINAEFGTMDDFKNLLKEAHSLGFRVIIDWVANHTGWDHVWTISHPEYYKRNSATGEFVKASGMDDIIELDYSNPSLRKAMIDAMKFWVKETNIDGFRCDLAFWVELNFWIEAKKELDKIRPLFWLAELDPLENADYMQVFDAAYTWTWMKKTEIFYKDQLPFNAVDNVLYQYQKTPGLKAWFTSNHDENSWNGTEYEKYGDAAKILTVFSCTWPGIPLIYSGQELPNKKRLAFFEKDVIKWNGRHELHSFYKTLLVLHTSHPALVADESLAPVIRLHAPQAPQVLAYMRKNGDREAFVLLNFSNHVVQFALPRDVFAGKYRNAFSQTDFDMTNISNIELRPWQYLVYVK